MSPQSANVLTSLRESDPAVRWLLFGVFVNQLGAFVQVFLVLFLVDHGASQAQAGVALGAYGAGSVLGALLGGRLADVLGRRATMTLSMLCAAALTISIGFLGDPALYPLLLVVIVADGAMTQAYRPAASAMLADLVPAERLVMTFSMYRVALNTGAVIGPLVAAWLMTVSWDLLFWADGLTAIACALLARRFLPARDPAVAADARPRRHRARRRAARRYGAVLRDGRYALYLFAMFASAVIYMQYFSVLPLQIRADGHPSSSTAPCSRCRPPSSSPASCSSPGACRRGARRPRPRGGIALLGLGLGGYGIEGGLVLLFAATLAGVLGQIVSGPTMFAQPARVAPVAARGSYAGASQAMFGLGAAPARRSASSPSARSATASGPRAPPRPARGARRALRRARRAALACASPRPEALAVHHRSLIVKSRPILLVGYSLAWQEVMAARARPTRSCSSRSPTSPASATSTPTSPAAPRSSSAGSTSSRAPPTASTSRTAAWTRRHPARRRVRRAVRRAAGRALRRAGRRPGAATILSDKALLRAVTSAAGIPNPRSERVQSPDEVRAFMYACDGPVVLKPANRQASVGTQVVRDIGAVDAAWDECTQQDEGVYAPDRAKPLVMLAEQFVAGDEYSVELLVRDGEPLFSNVTEKHLFDGPRPIELGHAVPAPIGIGLRERLVAQTRGVLDATGFHSGFVHCEWIVMDGVPHLVECAGRMPGDLIVPMIDTAWGTDMVGAFATVMRGASSPGRCRRRPAPARACASCAPSRARS